MHNPYFLFKCNLSLLFSSRILYFFDGIIVHIMIYWVISFSKPCFIFSRFLKTHYLNSQLSYFCCFHSFASQLLTWYVIHFSSLEVATSLIRKNYFFYKRVIITVVIKFLFMFVFLVCILLNIVIKYVWLKNIRIILYLMIANRHIHIS